MTSRIIVADDHPLFREAMVRTVYRVLPSAHVAEAGSLDEVLQLASVGEALDTLILDLRFPGLDSVSRLAQLKRQLPRTTLIVVSMVDDPVIIDQVMACGVDGFIGKSLSAEQMGAAILAVRAGEVLVRFAPSGLLPVANADSGTEHLTQRPTRRAALDRSGQDQQGDSQGLGYLALHGAHPRFVTAQGT